MSLSALAARRVFAAASHSSHEGGGQCVFPVALIQPKCLKASRFRSPVCNDASVSCIVAACCWTLTEMSAELAAGLHIHALWQIISFNHWYGLHSRTAALIYVCIVHTVVNRLYWVLRSCALFKKYILLLIVLHSEDLEDTDHRVGHSWCQRLHGQRLHEDAGSLAWTARLCAVSSPAYPLQGELTVSAWFTEVKSEVNESIFSDLLTSLYRNFPGGMETTLCSTTLTPTLCPTATRAPITEETKSHFSAVFCCTP